MVDLLELLVRRRLPVVLGLSLMLTFSCARGEGPTATAACGDAGASLVGHPVLPPEARHASVSGAASGATQVVSMLAVLADPARFHERSVVMIGYVDVGAERRALFPYREDADIGLIPNGIWLEPNGRNLNSGYAVVRGVIDAADRGHMGMFSAALRLDSLSPYQRGGPGGAW